MIKKEKPIEKAALLVGDRWKILILSELQDGKKTFEDIKTALSGADGKALSSSLRELEIDRVIQRVLIETQPPRVEYGLTPLGEKTVGIIFELKKFGKEAGGEEEGDDPDIIFGGKA